MAALGTVLILCALLQSTSNGIPPGAPKETVRQASEPVDVEMAAKLLKIKRIYVDSFGEDAASKQIQAMVINSLSESKRFVVTESKDKADAVLKRSTLELAHQELHSSTEVTVVGRAATADASKSTETISEARIAVRLVAADGDVIWTSTQESKGAKFRGASADVAERVVKQLLWELEKLQKQVKQ